MLWGLYIRTREIIGLEKEHFHTTVYYPGILKSFNDEGIKLNIVKGKMVYSGILYSMDSHANKIKVCMKEKIYSGRV